MEQEIKNQPSIIKKTLIGIACFLVTFLIYFTIMSVIAPGRKLKEIHDIYGFKQDEKSAVDEKIIIDSAYLAQLKTKSFLQSRVSLAETDSVYLTINFADTAINLEISGVVVHKTHISKMAVSKILKSENDYTLLNLMSKPFTIEEDISSIEKEPLMIKMAPKDTSEFEPDIMPDTADFEPVNYILRLNNGINLYVYQEENLNKGDSRHRFLFDLNDRLRSFIADFKKVIKFQIPEYHPFIKLQIPRDDAKILYRAIPVNGQIAIYR